MKYNLSLILDIFKKRIIKFYIIELIFMIICIFLREDVNSLELIFGLNEVKFLDYVLDIVRMVNICIILYTTFNTFFYDMSRNPEFVILRKDEKKYYLSKVIFLFVFILILKMINIILFMLFKFNMDNSVILYGIINTLYISSLGISIINSNSNRNYLMLSLLISLLFTNVIYITDYVILKIVLFIVVNIYNYISFNYHKIYNKLM